MQRTTWYNPVTNQISRSNKFEQENWINLGYSKVAEAFTAVDAKERPALYKATIGSWWINLTKLNSKIRHKLKKLHITSNAHNDHGKITYKC